MAATFTVRADDHALVLECDGHLDVLAARSLRAELHQLVASAARVVRVDLSRLHQLDAAGVAALAAAAVALRRRGARLTLLAPEHAAAGRILDYSGLPAVLAA